MSPWVLRGLRDGVVTTKWPDKPDEYATSWRGPATAAVQVAEDLSALCPTGAIGTGPDQGVRVDQGKCVLCGRCVAARPDVFAWSEGAEVATLTEVQDALAARTSALRRSVHLRHVDAGSDGAEEQEIAALLNPVYDIHRLGIFFTASPRHADVLLVTGAGAGGMAEPLRETYEGMPDPKIVIAVGTDAVSGGLMGHSGKASGGVGGIVPVDVWVPGSPPPPFSILHAILIATRKLRPGAAPNPGLMGTA